MRANPRYYARQLITACLQEPKRVTEIVTRFWQQVLADKRFAWRQRIVQEVDEVWRELTNRHQVTVSSHRQLAPTEQQLIRRELVKKFGPAADVAWDIKPHLLGGLVITVNNEKFDFSLKGTLDSMYYNLVK